MDMLLSSLIIAERGGEWDSDLRGGDTVELHDWIFVVIIVYVLLRCLALWLSVEGLIAYMVMHDYKIPTKDELRKAETWAAKKHLGLKTDWQDMP